MKCVCTFWLMACLAAGQTAPLRIDYPASGSVFPPDFAPPTFLFAESEPRSTAWQVEVRFSSGSPLRLEAPDLPLKVGEIDERAIASSYEVPSLSPEQRKLRTWRPGEAAWAEIKRRSVQGPAVVVIEGLVNGKPVSRGEVAIRTAKEPVGAPIFFRDVPLMPAEIEKGVIRPLPKNALPLVAWRLRYVSETKSRKLIDDMPVCMNCHSFSKDGRMMGLDLDGPANDKGLYALVPIGKTATIRQKEVVAWSSFRGKLGSKIRVGFMSQVSPDARYVVTMVSPSDLGKEEVEQAAPGQPRQPKDVAGNFYVNNFQDYRFLQVFYPTRGVLAWYSRETGKLQALPGADDPRYVHTNVAWSPDGKYLIFARAEARRAYEPGVPLAKKANDPAETPLKYDLFRIPFNEGRGGTPEPVKGASNNGMSNSFPKVSPDGKWIVYVQARNGLLMRPDSQLYMVPVEGGAPRRMNCNTPLMNSWHSFSPNGRWMVFSSKSRSPYTQMFLTYIDDQGQDFPPVLIEDATAANRAVNIPEFVNIGMDEWLSIEAPAADFYRQSDKALDLMTAGDLEAAVAEWKKALAMEPDDTSALNNLGAAYSEMGRMEEALAQFRRAIELDPDGYKTYNNLGVSLARAGRFEEAAGALEKSLELNPSDAQAQSSLGGVYLNLGRLAEARDLLEKSLAELPNDPNAHNNLGSIFAREGDFGRAIHHFERGLTAEPKSAELNFNLGRAYARTGRLEEGIRLVEKAVELTKGEVPVMLDRLADLYAGAGKLKEALAAARRALPVAVGQGDDELAVGLRQKIADLEAQVGQGR